jgi:hypothetical protein
MVRALNERATDMIGLGRPLTSEPHLCADLISGKSTGAKPNLVSESLQTGASIRQFPAIAKGDPPQDLSDPKVAAEMEAELKKTKLGADRQEEGDSKVQKVQKPYTNSKM